LGDNQRFLIEEVAEDGEPLAPAVNVIFFVNQCGVVVRDNIPISIREWHKPKGDDDGGVSFVDQISKDELWNTLMSHFNLPQDLSDGMKLKVKQWALKKMATQFQSFKKKIWSEYKNKKETPTFTGALEKQNYHWDAFKAYKESSEAVERSEKNKLNAAKKEYHHVLGPGGYKTAAPKWEKRDADLIAKGVTPETAEFPERSKRWLYGHGASLDPETGKLVPREKNKEKIQTVTKEIVKAIEKVQKGTFKPDRENDELTLALGNPEHGGRTRGYGTDVSWKAGFPECADSYKSRQRKKKQEADRIQRLEANHEELQRMVMRQQEQLDTINSQQRASERQQEDPAFDDSNVVPSQLKSSVGSTPLLGDHDALMDEAPMARYPVDDITEKKMCDLHQSMKNISFKVAVGFALPSEPGARFHGSQIPAGYARVGVDEVLKGYESLELDMAGGDGEKTLGEVTGGIILWKKKYIVFADSTPPPTPPCSNPPQQSPPLPDRDPSASPSRSPERQPSPPIKWNKRKVTAASPTKKKGRKNSKDKTPEKLPYDLTHEETRTVVAAEVKRHFAPQKPEPKEKLPEEVVVRFVKNLSDPEPKLPSDYERSISKSYSEQRKIGKKVPQLGEQEQQSIPPLKVFPDKDVHKDSTGLSVAQVIGDTGFPMAEIAWKYVHGESLVRPEQVPKLTTQMRRLHEWYLKVAKGGQIMLMVALKEEHFFQEYDICIMLEELFQLYNQDALDKSLVTCYCL